MNNTFLKWKNDSVKSTSYEWVTWWKTNLSDLSVSQLSFSPALWLIPVPLPAVVMQRRGSAGDGEQKKKAERLGKTIAWVSEKLAAQCQKNRVLTLEPGPELTASDIMMFSQRARRNLGAIRPNQWVFRPVLTVSICLLFHSLFAFYTIMSLYTDATR